MDYVEYYKIVQIKYFLKKYRLFEILYNKMKLVFIYYNEIKIIVNIF